MPRKLMCPHCGKLVTTPGGLTATHDYPPPMRQVCPGSRQNPRNPEGDRRVLWNGEPNPHIAASQRLSPKMTECTALCTDIEQERDELLAENERLREALARIANNEVYPELGSYRAAARRALGRAPVQ
jgi:hypothetical protein